jgi:hypothetical protein
MAYFKKQAHNILDASVVTGISHDLREVSPKDIALD